MSIEIIVPGRFIEPRGAVPFVIGAQGLFTLEAVNPSGVVSRRAFIKDRKIGPFRNLLLDQGLNFIADERPSAMWGAFHLGTGTTVPSVTNTALVSPIGSYITATRSSSHGVPPLYESTIQAAGLSSIGAFGDANLTEIGIGKVNGELFSRALILDASGNPTAFPISSDEQLRVTYEFKLFPPLEDANFEVDVNGLRQVTVRPLGLGGSYWTPSTASNELFHINSASNNMFYTGGLNDVTATGPLGGQVSGSTNGSAEDHPYVSNSFKRSHRRSWRSTDGDSAEFRTQVVSYSAARFQVQYDPPLAKNADQTMFLEYEIAWGRR